MLMLGTQSLDTLPGIGPARGKALSRLGLSCVGDLLAFFPRDYEDRSVQPAIRDLAEDVPACFEAVVTEAFYTSRLRRGMELTKGSIADAGAKVSVTFFNQAYVTRVLRLGESYLFYGKLGGNAAHRQMTNPYFEPLGQAGLAGGIVPIYPLTAGISHKLLGNLVKRSLPLAAEMEEVLPLTLLKEYELAQTEFSYRNIHFPQSFEDLALARRRLIFEELLCLSLGLALLRERRVEGGAAAFSSLDIEAFYRLLPFAPTGAQRRALGEMAQDLGQERPMNRLLQGDVGSGKTAVAAACIYLAVQNGKQSALMAPTDLLARQHYHTMEALLGKAGIRVGLLTGAMTAKQKRSLCDAVQRGELDLLVGTHALLTESVTFHALGLVITDEQHRFGVSQRAALSAKAGEGARAHVLVMSATPIPRTLALMVYGDLDLSVLDELPPGRIAVETLLIGEDKRARLYRFLQKQVDQGRQVYLVCPTVEEGELENLKAAEVHGMHLQTEIFPALSVAILHGRMKPKDKERVMADFVAGNTQVLVSTTVIEVGVDVPNASLMVIENAERFGLSQLHQLRGRVGRGAEKSYCVLISGTKSEVSRARLKVLVGTNDGFHIAEEDLRLRGPGDFFGARQHGLPQLHIADLAGDMRILKEAQEAAKNLIEADPGLDRAEHVALRKKVLRLFDEHRDSFT